MSGIVASLSGSGVVDDQKPVAAIGIAAGIFLVVTIFTVFSIWRRREALKASAFCPCIRGEKGIDDMTPEELKAANPYSEDYDHLAPAIARDPEAPYTEELSSASLAYATSSAAPTTSTEASVSSSSAPAASSTSVSSASGSRDSSAGSGSAASGSVSATSGTESVASGTASVSVSAASGSATGSSSGAGSGYAS